MGSCGRCCQHQAVAYNAPSGKSKAEDADMRLHLGQLEHPALHLNAGSRMFMYM